MDQKTKTPLKRLEMIKKIIEFQEVSNQFSLIEILEKEYGITTTQAVISRDLKKLGAVLKTKGDKRVYALLHKDTYKEMLKLAIQDIQYNETMIVIHTTAGIADFVGDMIDARELSIMGCISGENTILVVPKSIKKIKETYNEICRALYFKKHEVKNGKN